MDLKNLNNQNQNDEKIDIKLLFYKYLNNWLFFLLSFIVFSTSAYLYNRYTVPSYSVSSTLLIRDDNNTQLGAENLIEGLELFSGKKNLKNEIVILNSFSITRKVIDELKLGVSYKQHSSIVTNELYKNSPFEVIVDSSSLQLAGIDFKVKVIDQNKFKLEAREQSIFAYNILKEKVVKERTFDIDINQEFKFNQLIKGNCFSFKLRKI